MIADDHRLVRSGIIELLANVNSLHVVGEAENGQELIEKYFQLEPDLSLIDISMPLVTGFEALVKIREEDPDVKALFLSMHDSDEYIYYSRKIGGQGLISKNAMKGELVYAINKVAEGEMYFGPNVDDDKLKQIMKEYESYSIPGTMEDLPLTNREREVLKYIGQGKTSAQIADILCVSKRTIDAHRSQIMQKLNISNLVELIKYAIKYS